MRRTRSDGRELRPGSRWTCGSGHALAATDAPPPTGGGRRTRREHWLLRAGSALLLMLLASTPAAARSGAEETFWLDAPPGPAHGMPGSLAELVAPLAPAVIALSVERVEPLRAEPVLGLRRRGGGVSEAFGSAFIISKDGYALTAETLVANARRIRAQLPDGRRVLARLVGRDSRSRIALLKLDEGAEGLADFVPAPLGDSDSAEIGDWVIALGHSDDSVWEGELGSDSDPSLAKGIISGRERRVPSSLAKLIQTDLVVVDGYTGAPLIDMDGRVIGVVDRGLQPEGSLGISFAIPIREAKLALGQLRASGRVRHGWLGVQIQPLTPALSSRLGLAADRGALVSDVLDDTPAKQAKILPGDLIVEFAGTRIEESSDLPGAVAALEPGAEVPLVVLREGKRRKLKAVLGAQPEDPVPPRQTPPAAAPKGEPWGFAAEVLTPDLARRYGFPETASGLVVMSVEPLSPAERAELAPGDLLREANGVPLQSMIQLDTALATSEPLLRVQRGPTTVYRVLQRDRE